MSILFLKDMYILLVFLTTMALIVFLVNASSDEESVKLRQKLYENKWLLLLLAIFVSLLIITVVVGVEAGMYG